RVNVGTDYNAYKTLYYNYKGLPFDYKVNIELLFFYLNKVIGLFTGDSQWLFIVTSFLIYFFYYKVIVRECSYYELATYLFIAFGFYFSSLNILRQWIACGLVFYSFTFIYKNQLIKFLIVTTIATLFHTSAICIFPLYIFIKRLRRNSIRLLIMLTATVISFLPGMILNYINSFLISINANFKYFKYLDEIANSGASGYTFPLFCLIVFLGYIIVRKSIININENSEFHINILTVAFVITIIGQNLNIFARLQFYFLPILIIIIPNIVAALKGGLKIIAYTIVLILGFIFMLYSLYNNGGEPLPYNSIF
ncbi:EpsG family protein, partial [Cytobacillus firmus]|uniref:EpsG family protein n=1 Tax=Cytobacillus firmus TaxID=1399 RepID=UPI003002A473